MPNRILKESICSSDDINALTYFEEVFFYRLIVNADDYGRIDGRPAILKSKLFPLKNGITEKQIGEALNKLSTAGMVQVYEYDQKPFLQLISWNAHQQIRAKKSKYPAPANNGNHLKSDDCKCPRNPIQSESESESESEARNAPAHEDFLNSLNQQGIGLHKNIFINDYAKAQLLDFMTEAELTDYVNRLSGWLKSGKKVADHAGAINKWFNEDKYKREAAPSATPPPRVDYRNRDEALKRQLEKYKNG